MSLANTLTASLILQQAKEHKQEVITKKLFEITLRWREVMETKRMTDRACLVVACYENQVDAEWFDANIARNYDIIREMFLKHLSEKGRT
jgi:hypothetical protein